MPKVSPTRISHLLVFRDTSAHGRHSMPRTEIGALLSKWIEWHDSLQAREILRYCSAVDLPSDTVHGRTRVPALVAVSGRTGAIIGYLVSDATDLTEATEITRSCPGLEHGFDVDVFRSFDPLLVSTSHWAS